MHFTVKKLGNEDIALARALFYFFQLDDGITDPITPSDKYIKTLLAKDNFHVVVALQNEMLIGGLTGYELEMYKEEIKEMFLYEIAVKNDYRKNGVAKALIEFLKQLCITKGIKEMYVGTSTNNNAAIKLYQSTGGQEDVNIAWFVYSCS
jgi:aminoglycoside 3-N-acetyltransferase I